MYRFYNANNRNRFVDDCTIRAISVAEDLSWSEAYTKLSENARRHGMMMNSVEFIEDYLDDRYERECFKNTSVGDFVEEHPKGIYLITMPNHITVCIDGTIYDTFDCTDRVMWCAWKVSD